MSKRTLVTSALPYANGPIHLGHLAGAYLPADLYVRYKRLTGEDVLYICGSDEHGVPITIAAENEDVSPQDIVDRNHKRNKQAFEEFGMSFDYYGRTSSSKHHQTSQQFFMDLYEKDILVQKTEEQLYDPKAEMFLPDRYVQGTCPHCGYEEAYGDQCENCGTSLSPTELIDPISAITGDIPETRKTKHWYMPLGDYQDRIANWIDEQDDWKPNVTGQIKSWINDGLKDRAVTRDLNWGVPVPLEGAADKVLYVWFDAVLGYLSFTKEWAEQQDKPEQWEPYWKDKETDLIHFIGKDNIVFHCIMFPSMIMAHGDFILPENVPANEFMNLEGKKLSTSRGWAVWLEDYLEDFEADLLRYVLGTTLPETKDSDFSWEGFQNRVNSELANILGNFVFRTTSFTHKYFNGQVPELSNPTEHDREALKQITEQKEKASAAYEQFKIHKAIAETMELARVGNKYFTDTEPWITRKENPEACGNTLHICLQITAALSVLFEPILPSKMEELSNQLNLSDTVEWDDVDRGLMTEGSQIKEAPILFKKIEDDQVEEQLEKLRQRTSQQPDHVGHDHEPIKEETTFNDFMKIDLRAGQIIEASAIEKADNLLELKVDMGFEQRTIVSGLANDYEPDALTGQKVCVVANLAPKKLMGVESNGMILMGEESDGSLTFVQTDAKPGSIIS